MANTRMIPTLHPDGRVTVAYVVDYLPASPEVEEDQEAGYCPQCSGSGEGMYDGTRCSACGGSGIERGEGEQDDRRDYEREE